MPVIGSRKNVTVRWFKIGGWVRNRSKILLMDKRVRANASVEVNSTDGSCKCLGRGLFNRFARRSRALFSAPRHVCMDESDLHGLCKNRYFANPMVRGAPYISCGDHVQMAPNTCSGFQEHESCCNCLRLQTVQWSHMFR